MTEYRRYWVTIASPKRCLVVRPSGVPRDEMEIKLDSLGQRTIDIFHRWLAKGNITERDELVVLGTSLYNILFDESFSEEFWTELQKVRNEDDVVLRLVLEFRPAAKDLARLPWEYIYFPDSERWGRGFFLAADPGLILARHVLPRPEEPPRPSAKRLKVLVVVSAPASDRYSDIRPKPVLEQLRRLSKAKGSVLDIAVLRKPTKTSLQEAIDKHKPHIVHFIGHGEYVREGQEAEGRLVLLDEGDKKSPSPIGDDDLADCFQSHEPRIIFLHACEGAATDSYGAFQGVALKLVYSRVPAVVAMQFQIENGVANTFAKSFYQALGDGKPIDQAVQAGRLQLGKYLEQRNFSSRAFGSPVVFLKSAEALTPELQPPVVEAPPEERRPRKVPCPYPDACGGYLLSVAPSCPVCRRPVEPCPTPDCKAGVKVPGEPCAVCGAGGPSTTEKRERTVVALKPATAAGRRGRAIELNPAGPRPDRTGRVS